MVFNLGMYFLLEKCVQLKSLSKIKELWDSDVKYIKGPISANLTGQVL